MLAFIFEHLYKTRQEADMLIFYGMRFGGCKIKNEGLITLKHFALNRGKYTSRFFIHQELLTPHKFVANVMSARIILVC